MGATCDQAAGLDAPVRGRALSGPSQTLASGASRTGKNPSWGLTPDACGSRARWGKGKKPAFSPSDGTPEKRGRRRETWGAPHGKEVAPSARRRRGRTLTPPPRFGGLTRGLATLQCVAPAPSWTGGGNYLYDGGGKHRARYQGEPAQRLC
ncbi:hypothetical protein GWK47_015749 [Chionoecetes opilio]|uniref:Uncharacterized protein n=1 Tax=Chionoecetes opilio TaxID=41210 RepID=A0A8J5CMU6_CHIOP|nr:hypothetical protein GWK47_015749 [Chionoecetes opilio]